MTRPEPNHPTDPDAIPRPPAVVGDLLAECLEETAVTMSQFARRVRDVRGATVGPTQLLRLSGPLLAALDGLEREISWVSVWLPPVRRPEAVS